MIKPTVSKIPNLKLNSRNLLTYIVYAKEKHPHAPCFIPKCPNNDLVNYLRALEILEEHHLIKVNRSTDFYTNWIVSTSLTKEDLQ